MTYAVHRARYRAAYFNATGMETTKPRAVKVFKG